MIFKTTLWAEFLEQALRGDASDVVEEFLCPCDGTRYGKDIAELCVSSGLRDGFFCEAIQSGVEPLLNRREIFGVVQSEAPPTPHIFQKFGRENLILACMRRADIGHGRFLPRIATMLGFWPSASEGYFSGGLF